MSGNFVRLEVSRFCSPPDPPASLVESIANDGAYLGLGARLA